MLSGSLGSSNGVESVTILITCFFNAFLDANISMVLPYDFDILAPSTPGTTAVLSTIIGSGSLKISVYFSLNFVAMSRVISRCCFWSFPTGTISTSYIKISAAISTGYVNNPVLDEIPRALLSLNE